MTQEDTDNKEEKSSGSVLSTLQTILGAVFGIQSEKKRQQDFAKADPGKLIAIGIVTVIVIVIGMIIVVNSVLNSAGH